MQQYLKGPTATTCAHFQPYFWPGFPVFGYCPCLCIWAFSSALDQLVVTTKQSRWCTRSEEHLALWDYKSYDITNILSSSKPYGPSSLEEHTTYYVYPEKGFTGRWMKVFLCVLSITIWAAFGDTTESLRYNSKASWQRFSSFGKKKGVEKVFIYLLIGRRYRGFHRTVVFIIMTIKNI